MNMAVRRACVVKNWQRQLALPIKPCKRRESVMSITHVKPVNPPLVTQPLRSIRNEAEAIAAAHDAAREIALLATDHRLQNDIPWRQAEILSQSGVTTIAVPKALGGIGASIATIVETVRIISTADGGVGQLLQIHQVMLRGVLARPEGEARNLLVRDILAGKRLGHAGAETGGKTKFDHKTTAQRNAEGKWVVNGHKFYTTGSHLAEWISAGAKTAEGDIGFLVNRHTPGVFLDDDWDAFGQQHSVSGSVRFDNVVLDDRFVSQRKESPADDGKEVTSPVRTNLTWPQILHAAIDTGIARGALDAAVHYLNNNAHVWVDADVERAVQEPLIIKAIGDYAIAVRTAESLLRDAAELFDEYRNTADNEYLQNELILAVATARAQSDHASIFIGSDIFSLLGASSSYRKFNLHRFFGDARVHTTHDPIRWRLHHIGNYYLNDVAPDEYSAASARKRAAALVPDQLGRV
jgi:alkylation response protein AidB-like acyl-CoA dehydrogenase